ncbi:putative NBD/HSP70 family sugar kinase [Cryobacterium mesophilum]|uniref:ROK family transcriptional regulator n=1 Tax=Terrimesophilobacter mesophilus TaxID=433647 RepID=A0A4R8VDV1_9MICO|nr:ROK family transcriptional regulator [Terrimesophilobacter mesophilus]MBB5633275.1 putative NBD/HSP70 family sugar kinase [Terrimesophilobacter mesophilus]TFB80017.1 ROK family transcriptional regulator [Terrimesophilobacter mesophilus]
MASERRTPGSQTSLREANRARIVDAIKKHGGLTQVELAGVTGLSPATVSNIVKELSAGKVLHTTPTTQSGRRAQYVTLAHALGLVAGVHFSTRHMRIALADVAHTVVAEHHLPLAKDHRADNELDRTTLLIADMLDNLKASMNEVLAVGIAIPAPMDRKTGTIAHSGILRGWDGIPVAEVMKRRLKRPVFVDNSANLGAFAELRIGAARGKSDAVYIDVGDGIGAGLVINGQVYRGFNGSAGEFGHTTIQENGPLCRCGNRGCLEAIAGGYAILENLKPTHGNLKLNDIVTKAMGGDAGCVRALAEAGRHIGVAAANLSNLFDPERLVVGGELSRAGEILIGPIRHALERSVIVDEDSMPDIVQGQLGARAATLGAVAFAIDRVAIGPNDKVD